MMLKSILSKIAVIFFASVIGYLIVKVGVSTYKRYTLQLRINEAKAKVEQLERANEEIKKLLAHLGSEEFLTLKLKEEFSLKNPDERIAIVKQQRQGFIAQEAKPSQKENWQKWWDIFFGLPM